MILYRCQKKGGEGRIQKEGRQETATKFGGEKNTKKPLRACYLTRMERSIERIEQRESIPLEKMLGSIATVNLGRGNKFTIG